MFNFCHKIALFDVFSGLFKLAETYRAGNMKQQVIKSDPGNPRYFKMSPGMVSAVKNPWGIFSVPAGQNTQTLSAIAG